ncbi:hypothetical protein [Mucilaginibacter celer]|uniref:Uncharacterized protein n=1 Tax=Mucilaginibacter celer TaxID=2305508 RepID=A0A494VWB6_9SPHI|nr:hypothetical protein [Mucilaginibacter celer]AYL95763.1 hypothetical protein HYN43_010885 [Mucilaginibacter celer]
MNWEILYHLPFIFIVAVLTQPGLKKLIGKWVSGWGYYAILIAISILIYIAILAILLWIFFHDTRND